MDVGFNNTNTLHLALENPFLEDVVWLVEASSEERFQIWKKYHDQYEWQEVSTGHGYTLLTLEVSAFQKGKTPVSKPYHIKETLPVTINFTYAIVNGYKICFYDSSSLLVHHGYIEAFLHTYFQRTHDHYTRWNHTNATNFHNCIHYLKDLDLDPRETTYDISGYKSEYYIFDAFKL